MEKIKGFTTVHFTSGKLIYGRDGQGLARIKSYEQRNCLDTRRRDSPRFSNLISSTFTLLETSRPL